MLARPASIALPAHLKIETASRRRVGGDARRPSPCGTGRVPHTRILSSVSVCGDGGHGVIVIDVTAEPPFAPYVTTRLRRRGCGRARRHPHLQQAGGCGRPLTRAARVAAHGGVGQLQRADSCALTARVGRALAVDRRRCVGMRLGHGRQFAPSIRPQVESKAHPDTTAACAAGTSAVAR